MDDSEKHELGKLINNYETNIKKATDELYQIIVDFEDLEDSQKHRLAEIIDLLRSAHSRPK